jgi:GntR family transcriptional regulator, carbon starvation induced regulator
MGRMTRTADLDEESAETLGDTVFGRLKNDILLGVLAPGSRLRFNILQERYEVGTSPLREALSRLAAGRLVLQETNRGFRVPPISRADFADITKVRREIECPAIVESVRQGDNDWEERLIIADHRLRRVSRDGKKAFPDHGVSGEWESRHREFHLALIGACGSEWTLHFCGLLYDQFDRYRRSVGTDAGAQAPLARHHALLVEAALARDATKAGEVLADHIDQTAELILKYLGGSRPAAKRRTKRAQTTVPPSTSKS